MNGDLVQTLVMGGSLAAAAVVAVWRVLKHDFAWQRLVSAYGGEVSKLRGRIIELESKLGSVEERLREKEFAYRLLIEESRRLEEFIANHPDVELPWKRPTKRLKEIERGADDIDESTRNGWGMS